MFSDKKSDDMLLQPWDFYPELYPGARENAEQAKANAELDNYKAARKLHALRWNQRFKEADDGPRENENRDRSPDEES